MDRALKAAEEVGKREALIPLLKLISTGQGEKEEVLSTMIVVLERLSIFFSSHNISMPTPALITLIGAMRRELELSPPSGRYTGPFS